MPMLMSMMRYRINATNPLDTSSSPLLIKTVIISSVRVDRTLSLTSSSQAPFLKQRILNKRPLQ